MDFDGNNFEWQRERALQDRDEMSSEVDYGDDVHPLAALGGPDHVLVPKGEAYRRISKLLGHVEWKDPQFSCEGVEDKLPSQPGLYVEGVGRVSIPLHQLELDHIAGYCSEENQVWTIPGERVKMKNLNWEAGIQKVCNESAATLGFKGIEFEPVLSKVVIYGPGGGAERHLNVEPDDRVAAVLVISLPSECSGGKLAVYEAGTDKMEYYDFGQTDNSAEFTAHCVVSTAGCFHVVEKVTSGYLLTIEYLLKLPLGLPSIRGKTGKDLLSLMLSDAIASLGEVQPSGGDNAGASPSTNVSFSDDEPDESTHFALMLSGWYNKSKMKKGVESSLEDTDKRLFQALTDANARLPPEKQLKFYLACLKCGERGSYFDWDGKQSATWYSINGGVPIAVTASEWTNKLNFLNPEDETLEMLWHGLSKCEPYAIIGWPFVLDIPNTFEFMGRPSASSTLSMDSSGIRSLLTYEAYNLAPARSNTAATLDVCMKMCKVVTESKDIAQARVFLTHYFVFLQNKRALVPLLSDFVKAFGWSEISAMFDKALCRETDQASVILLLLIANTLDERSPPRLGMTQLAIEKTRGWISESPSDFPSAQDFYILLTHVIACQDPRLLRKMEKIFKLIDVRFLDRAVSAVSKCLPSWSSPTLRGVFSSMIARRREWLAGQIAHLEKPFVWKIPVADFPDAQAIANFLQSSTRALDIRGFAGIGEARKRAQLLRAKIQASLSISALGSGRSAYVHLQKVGGSFDSEGSNLLQAYKAEMARFVDLSQDDHQLEGNENSSTMNTPATTITGSKRSREETPAFL